MALALRLLIYQCNTYLQTSRPGSINTIKHELATILYFKGTMDHMDLMSRNIDDGSINFVDPRIIAT